MAAIGNALKAAALLASAVLIAPCRAALDSAAFEAEQRRILEHLEQIQSRDGLYSPALLEELKQLILLYRENDSPSLALVTIERALQVVRANSGLYSLEQVPLLWQRIESEETLDNHAEAWEVEQELLALVRRYPDDAQVVPVLRRVADRQMQVLGQSSWPAKFRHKCSTVVTTTGIGRAARSAAVLGAVPRSCKECWRTQGATTQMRSPLCFATEPIPATSCASSRWSWCAVLR